MPEIREQAAAIEAQPMLPWTHEAFHRILDNPQRQAHAYLLAGHAGMGKTAFAEQVARAMLCMQPENAPCGHCQSCRIYDCGSHPDLHVLQSDKVTSDVANIFSIYAPRYLEDENIRKKRKRPSPDIKIDQVRGVIPDINSRPQLSSCRIIIINQAEDLNINAANSILKSLEEPPADTYFILISHDPGRLLPTIRSRCNRLDFRPPDSETVLEWLRTQVPAQVVSDDLLVRAAGVPLKALALARGETNEETQGIALLMLRLARGQIDPVNTAMEMNKIQETRQLYTQMQLITSHIIRNKNNAGLSGAIDNGQYRDLIDLGNRLNFKQLYAFLDKVSENKKLAGGPLDETLMLEDNLISWQRMFS